MSYNNYSDSPSYTGGLLPSHRKYQNFAGTFEPALDTLVPMEHLRRMFSLLEDDSDDQLIEQLRFDSALRVESITGKPCLPREVTCYYRDWSNRFSLINDWDTVENISIIYTDQDNQSILDFDTIVEDASGEYFVVMTNDTIALSQDVASPVNISFNYVPSQDYQAAAREAATFLIQQKYFNAGGTVMSNVDMEAIAFDMLRPYRALIS